MAVSQGFRVTSSHSGMIGDALSIGLFIAVYFTKQDKNVGKFYILWDA